jgi:hypothetical protein
MHYSLSHGSHSPTHVSYLQSLLPIWSNGLTLTHPLLVFSVTNITFNLNVILRFYYCSKFCSIYHLIDLKNKTYSSSTIIRFQIIEFYD